MRRAIKKLGENENEKKDLRSCNASQNETKLRLYTSLLICYHGRKTRRKEIRLQQNDEKSSVDRTKRKDIAGEKFSRSRGMPNEFFWLWPWLPTNKFYCSADGNYEVTLITKANVYHNGLVNWVPPAVYKSSCSIDVEVQHYSFPQIEFATVAYNRL